MVTEEQKTDALAEKVLNETILVEGDGSKEWALRAARVLTKSLRKYGKLDVFYELLASGANSCCVMDNDKLPGSYGRVNLFILKLYRFPWIRFTNQIRSTAICRYSFNRKSTQVCINPLHYKVVDVPVPPLPPVIVNKAINYGVPIRMEIDDESEEGGSSTEAYDHSKSWKDKYVPNITVRGDEIRQKFDELARDIDPASPSSPVSPPLDLRADAERHKYQSGMSSPASMIQSPGFFGNLGGITENVHDLMPLTPCEDTPKYLTGLGQLENMAGHFECVEFAEKPEWISLSYYEETAAVCEDSKFHTTSVLVDGYTNPLYIESRFSTGFFNGPKNSGSIAEARSCIGRGLRFFNFGGSVYVESLCSVPLFVQSLNANLRHSFNINTVIKIPPCSTMRVFDLPQFAKQISAAAEKSYQDVYALSKTCTLRVSFGKGWGSQYKRTSVTRSPCWVEAHLINPLSWIDRVLKCMGTPPEICSSRT